MIIYTPFYVAPILGPHITSPIPLPENIAGVARDLYKDSLIYGLAISRTYGGDLTRVSPNTGFIPC